MSLILSGTDGLSDVDGSAATPAIRGTDANTGIFFPAADTIAFAEGGVEAMRLDSSGNLGIGTSSPSQKLEVAGNMYINTSGNPYLQIKTSGAGNNPYIRMQADTNYWDIQSTFSNTNDDLLFQYNGTALLDLDKNGNLGLGVTPSAWSSTASKALQVDKCSLVQIDGFDTSSLSTNAFYNGSWRYIGTAPAVRYDQYSGTHRWQTAPSGTAGNAITFTQAMTLDASGRLGLGTTSPAYSIDMNSGTNPAQINFNSSIASGTNFKIAQGIQGVSNSGMQIYDITNSAVRMAIDGSGNLLVGATSVVLSSKVLIAYNGITNNGIVTNDTSSSGVTYSNVFIKNGSSVGGITQTTTATAYNTSSDYRLKNVTGALTGYKERLMSLQPKQGTWKADGSEFRGFVAHDFANQYPKSVVGEKDAVDEEGKPIYQGMQASSSEVMADLVAMVKDLIAENDSLKARLDAANL